MFKKLLISTCLISPVLANISLVDKQWASKNTGQEYTRKVGEHKRKIIHGTPGFDINFPTNLSKLEETSKEVIVAVIDTGVDIHHPDLKGRIWESPKCKGLSKEEREKLVCNGLNVLDSNGDVSDSVGHGTHIAGVIASAINGVGTSGVTHSKIKIMPMKAARKKFKGYTVNGKLTSELMASAVMYALRNGAQVVNLSLGYPKVVVSPKVKATFDYAIKRGLVIVAAAGNNNKNKPVFPCNFPGVICVGAMDATGEKLSSSNFGHKVDIYAPGENIISTIPTGLESKIIRVNGYDARNGTSHAAPYVAGLAALIKSQDPTQSVEEVTNKILSFAKLVKAKDGRVYPVVNFNDSLSAKSATNLSLDVKGLDEVTVSANGKFKFDIPVKSSTGNVSYSIKSSNSDIVIENATGSINLDKTKNILVSGKLNNFLSDAETQFTLDISKDGVSISKVIDIDLNTVSRADFRQSINGIPAPAIIKITKHYKRSSLQRVLTRDSTKTTQDLFFLNPKLKSQIILLKEGKSYSPIKLNLENSSEISSVIKIDINLDGIEDYFVYGATPNKRSHFFAYFDAEGRPLFKNNYWKFPSTRFGGLPFVRGFEKFSYLKITTKEFGTFLTPALVRQWDLPFEDNSNDPIDRLMVSKKKRGYYFLPALSEDKVSLSLRTLDSYSTIMKLKKDLDVESFEQLDIAHIIPQTNTQKLHGKLMATYVYGEGFKKKTALVEYTSVGEFQIINKDLGKNVEKNDLSRFRSSLDRTYSDDFMYVRRFKRNFLRIANNKSRKAFMLKSQTWSNPIVGTVDVFTDGESRNYFIESRYKVFSIKEENGIVISKTALPVNRESSYPGLSFSQSFQGVNLGNGSVGVFTDTKSIYGETVGVMTDIGGSFARPVKLNILMKNNCVSLGQSEISNVSTLLMHCTDGKKSWIEKQKLSI